MTIAQIFVTYATCWWLVLFMVLPYRAKPAENHAVGHARGAPANPMIRKKAFWATLLAVIPTLLVYFAASDAKAADAGIYTTKKSACAPLQRHVPAADVTARDGYGTGGKQVKPATLESESEIAKGLEHVNIPLRIPAAGQLDAPTTANPSGNQRNVDLSQSFVDVGGIEVNTKTGEALLNGQPIAPQQVYPEGCETSGEK